MDKPYADELPTIRANVDQLLQELKQIARHSTPTNLPQQSGSSSEETNSRDAKDQ